FVMAEKFVETALMRLVARIPAEVPFAKQAGPVSFGLKQFRECNLTEPKGVATEAGVVESCPQCIATRHQSSSCRRTDRCGVVAGELDALPGEAVQGRGIDVAVSAAAEIPHALIIRHDQQN